MSFCEFGQLYKTVIIFSAWYKSRDSGANWSKLEHMLTTLVENHEKDISNITDSLGNILVQIEEIENRPVPTTTQAPTFNGPLSKYSCNKITKTWI